LACSVETWTNSEGDFTPARLWDKFDGGLVFALSEFGELAVVVLHPFELPSEQ